MPGRSRDGEKGGQRERGGEGGGNDRISSNSRGGRDGREKRGEGSVLPGQGKQAKTNSIREKTAKLISWLRVEVKGEGTPSPAGNGGGADHAREPDSTSG